jgi:DNA-binding CsgD family transcriptional regulator/tetratricopeptide (TPR) repeat protein
MSGIASPRASLGLIGRERELAELEELLAAARRGRGGLVWIAGEAGIGKSRLVGEALARARERGWVVLAAGAEDLERRRPFALIERALGPQAPARLDPRGPQDAYGTGERGAGGPVGGPLAGELEPALSETLLAALEDRCASAPVMLALDDLQWADEPSLRLLARLSGAVAELGLAVACTLRRLPRRPDLERVVGITRERGARWLELSPLEPEAALELAAAVAAGRPGPSLRAQVQACGGNPLFIRTLIEALAADGQLARDADGLVEASLPAPPPSLDTTVLGRLSVLGEPALEALRLAAVLGSPFATADLALVSGRSAVELLAPLRDALALGVLVEEGERLAFAHDVVREALYRDVPASVRASLHLEFARLLRAAGAGAAQVAEHLLRGARRGDRDAIASLVRAAREVSALGPGAAAELLSAAVGLAEPDDPLRPQLLRELASNLVAAGRREQGEAAAREALGGLAGTDEEAALRLTIARALIERGRPAEAFAEAARAAAAPRASPRQRAQALLWGIAPPLFAHDFDAAQAAAERALQAGRQAGDPAAVATALTRLAHVAGFRGEFAAAERLAAQAVAVVQADGGRESHQLSHAHLNHALALADCDRAREGIEVIATARAIYRRLGSEETLRNSHHYAGYPLFLAGEWDDALAELETAARLSEEYGLAWTVDVLAMRATILARRDRVGEAAVLSQRARRALAAGAPEFRIGWVAWAQALVDQAQGRSAEALEGLWPAWEAVSAAGALAEQRAFAPDLAGMLAAAGERGRADEVAAALQCLAAANPSVPSIAALALRCRALSRSDPDGLVAAHRAYAAADRPYERAQAAEDAAVALAGAGELDAARRLADQALAAYAALGALRDAARTRARLRAVGIRRGSRASRRRPASGWESLTPSERRVAELAAEGLSNPRIAERLVVSRHTVATHMAHALAKLGLRSRYELAAARERPRREQRL